MARVIKQDQTVKTSEHDVSTFTEYPFASANLSLGISEINGRYPAEGADVDEAIEQLWYVLDGSGTVTVGDTVYDLAAGDMLHLDKGEQYVIDGQLKLMVASAPAWTPEQHTHVN